MYIIVFDKKSYTIGNKLYSDIAEYIDDNYAEEISMNIGMTRYLGLPMTEAMPSEPRKQAPKPPVAPTAPSEEYGEKKDTAKTPTEHHKTLIPSAAPIAVPGLYGMSVGEYVNLFAKRIEGMLKCVAFCGYENLVLGAFGCGAFGNDARIVSDIFRNVLERFESCGAFLNIDFAVLSNSSSDYNLREFMRNFGGN